MRGALLGGFRSVAGFFRPKKPKSPLRENVESQGVALAAALLIRFFVVEAFKIPTGSMATSLLGLHKNIKCERCKWRYPLDRNRTSAVCPLCGDRDSVTDLEGAHILHNWGGDRILVNKFIYTRNFTQPRRWDVIVFKYPLVELRCKECGHVQDDVKWQDGVRHGTSLLGAGEIADWPRFCAKVVAEKGDRDPSPGGRVWQMLPNRARSVMEEVARGGEADKRQTAALVNGLNEVLKSRSFYREADFSRVDIGDG